MTSAIAGYFLYKHGIKRPCYNVSTGALWRFQFMCAYSIYRMFQKERYNGISNVTTYHHQNVNTLNDGEFLLLYV
jgi:hypothetical protein